MAQSRQDNVTELLERADKLAREAGRGPRARGKNDNTAGGIGAHREALVEEIEALRLTLIALFGPLAQAVDLGLALLASSSEEDSV